LNDFQIKNLEEFVVLLLKCNNEYNLIGKSTIQDMWNRHILDCAQLMQFIDNKNKKFADFGSGAGFPGVVLSIIGLKEIHLIEKSFRKSQFLQQAKIISPNRIFIHQSKLEEMKNLKFDCITSRALAPLDKLLKYSSEFLNEDGYCLFLKGKNLSAEIDIAKKDFEFNYTLHKSLTASDSNIIKINNIKLR